MLSRHREANTWVIVTDTLTDWIVIHHLPRVSAERGEYDALAEISTSRDTPAMNRQSKLSHDDALLRDKNNNV